MPTTSCMMGIVWVGGAPETKCLRCNWGHLHRERIPAQRSHSWHYCILAGSQGDAPRRRCEQKSGRGLSGRTQSQRKTRKMLFSHKVDRGIFLCCWHDWEEFSHQPSYLPVKHSATSHLIHPCHCTTHREGLFLPRLLKQRHSLILNVMRWTCRQQPANGSRNDWKDLRSRERHLNRKIRLYNV